MNKFYSCIWGLNTLNTIFKNLIQQPCDIKHLVEAIWKRQSCLSGATDENELELVRYNVEDCWTPWNCMLVTREEAAILSGIPNPKEVIFYLFLINFLTFHFILITNIKCNFFNFFRKYCKVALKDMNNMELKIYILH